MEFRDLKELFKDHQIEMSEFQDDYFVTKKAGGTLYGQYKQSLRELHKRYRTLRELTYDREKIQIEIDKKLHEAENLENEFDKKLAEIESRRMMSQMEEFELSFENTMRQFTRFYQHACSLKESLTEEHGELTPEKRYELEQHMWEHKMRDMICLDLSTQGRVSPPTLEFIQSMPHELGQKALKTIKNQEALTSLLNQFENKSGEHLPKDLELMDFSELSSKLLDNFKEEDKRLLTESKKK